MRFIRILAVISIRKQTSMSDRVNLLFVKKIPETYCFRDIYSNIISLKSFMYPNPIIKGFVIVNVTYVAYDSPKHPILNPYIIYSN